MHFCSVKFLFFPGLAALQQKITEPKSKILLTKKRSTKLLEQIIPFCKAELCQSALVNNLSFRLHLVPYQVYYIYDYYNKK